MNEKTKNITICIAVFVGLYLVFACVCLAVGAWRSRTDTRAGITDSQRVERYEDGSESAQNAVTELEDGLNDVAEQMHSVGREIESGITDVGELREVGDRIAEASSDIEGSAGRIEKGIQRIEQILSEAEESSCVLADYGGSSGSDVSD